eukprot:10962702-Ditylum_brightwellii.AAC.2
MKALEATYTGGIKVKGKQKIEGMTQDGLAKEIKKAGNAMRKFPAWYCTKIKNSKIRKGEFILKELENLQSILVTYSKDLPRQTPHNRKAAKRDTWTSPDKTNTNFLTVD